MKHQVTRFKNLTRCLQELEPFVRNGAHLETGKPFKRFDGMRSREVLANWLLCVSINSFFSSERLCFVTDPSGGDGVITDNLTGETWATEHIMVPARHAGTGSTDDLILNAVTKKQAKGGSAYAAGKTLVVFLNAAGEPWFPSKVARSLPADLAFDAVWVVGLQSVESGRYTYAVTRLDLRFGQAPAWRVHISEDFNAWQVETVQ